MRRRCATHVAFRELPGVQLGLGEERLRQKGFVTGADMDAAFQDALEKDDEQERYSDKIATLSAYADAWRRG